MSLSNYTTILHTIDTTGPGGAETVFLDLAKRVTIEGFKNIALIKGPGWVEEQLKKREIEYFILKPSGFLSLPYYYKLYRLFRKQRVALVQAHLFGSILSCSIVCTILRIPLVATLHGQVDINPKEKGIFLKQLLIAKGVGCLVTVSQSLAGFTRSRGFFKKKPIDIIYNGIDTGSYYKNHSGELRKTLGIKEDTTLVGSLGNVRPAKNYDLLISAAAKLHAARGRQIHFAIAGHQRKSLMDELDALADRLNIKTHVHFLGFMDDTAKFLSELDLFLLCSSSEGFSIATLEAMATGLPVIATRCGGPEEIITDRVNGILIPKNDPDAIVEAINNLNTSKEFGESLGIAAKKHIHEKFSMTTMVDAYGKIYLQFLLK